MCFKVKHVILSLCSLSYLHCNRNVLFQLLREQIVRSRVGTTDEGINTRHFPAYERENLVKQLEASTEKVTKNES